MGIGWLGIIIILILLMTFVLLICIRKKTMKVFIIFSFIIAGTLILTVMYNTMFRYNDKEISVAMSTDENCNDFTLDIKCKVLSYERIYAEFATPLNISEVEDEIQRQYENATIVFVNDKQINVTEDNAVVSIKLEEESEGLFGQKNVYFIETECISLSQNEQEFVSIPFPKEYLNIEGMYDNEMEILCDREDIIKFYDDFSNVQIEGDEIIINQEPVIKIKIINDKVYITIGQG